jgi:uncharacterized membrane protein
MTHALVDPPVLVRAAVLGAAAGARSVTPLAALAASAPPAGGPGNAWLRWTRLALGAAAVGELVADKLPTTPSRLAAAPLAGRVVFGALAGGAYARRRGAGVVLPALVGAAAALGASHAGAWWRRRASGVPAALAEDTAAVALAWAAARR